MRSLFQLIPGLTALLTAGLIPACMSQVVPPPASEDAFTQAPNGQPKISTIAGHNGNVAGFRDSDGVNAQFNFPEAIVLDPTEDNLYIADGRNHAIRKLELASGIVTTVAGNGHPGFADGPQGQSKLNLPRSMTLAPDGKTLFFTDTGNFAVRALDLASKQVTTFAGGTAGTHDGQGRAAQFGNAGQAQFWAGGLAIDASANVMYVADSANQTLRTIDLTTADVKIFAGQPGVQGAENGGLTTGARFNKPNQLVLDGNGNLLVGESDNPDIRMINLQTQTISTVAGLGLPDDQVKNVCDGSNPNFDQRLPNFGEPIASCGQTDGPGNVARFRFPYGMALDVTGSNVYIVDAHNDLVRKMSLTDGSFTVSSVAGVQKTIFSDETRGSTDSTATSAGTLSHPANVAVRKTDSLRSKKGTLYISDRSASCIRKVVLP